MSSEADDIFAEMMREEEEKLRMAAALYNQKASKPASTANSTLQRPSNSTMTNTTRNNTPTTTTLNTGTASSSTPQIFVSSEIESLLQQPPQQILQNLQRDINCLSSSEKGKRVGSLKKLKTLFDVMEQRRDQIPIVDYMKFFFSHIYQPLIKLFGNEAEYCRETSVKLILTFSSYITVNEMEEALPFLMPILEERMRGPKDKFMEESEEVRHSLVKLMKAIIEKCTTKLEDPDYLQKIVYFIEKAFEDFHGVKAEASQCVISLCRCIRESMIKLFSGSLIKHILPYLKHQRYSVRSDVLDAIKYLVACGSVEILEDLHAPLKELCLDRSNVVRQKVLDVIVDWALNLRDKYSFQHNFAYYLLLLSSDEISSIAKSAFDYLIEMGRQYERDYEDEVNEIRMYDENENTPMKSIMYQSQERLPPLPSVLTQRPLLGARLLAGKKHLSKIVTYLLEDFEDWSLPRRICASKSMQICIILAERNITQHLDKILLTLFNSCGDEEKDLREESQRCISLIGYFVEPETYLSIVYNNSRPEYAASPKFLSTVLRCLALMLQHGDATLVNHSLMGILSKMSAQHLIYNDEPNVKLNVLNVMYACMENGSVQHLEAGFEIFLIILKICSQPNTIEAVSKSGLEVLQKEAATLQLQSTEELYAVFFEKALGNLTQDVNSWDKLSPNFYSFEALLKNAPKSTVQYFDKVLEIFSMYLTPDRDPIMILRLLSVLNSILYSCGMEISQTQLQFILSQFIYPNSKWRSGRVYADVRKAAISCFSCILRQKLCTNVECIQSFASESQFDHLMSCMDDDFDPSLRALCVKIMIDYLDYCYQYLSDKQWDNLCTEMRNRMEDENDMVRTFTATSMAHLLLYLPAHLADQATAMFFCLSTHMDDPNVEIRKACYQAFKTIIENYKRNQHLSYIKDRLDVISKQLTSFMNAAIHIRSDYDIPYSTLLN
ncbi:hypothetical protein C9374_010007 [Naegleria lovaniensis]|uniref:Uncharacterized protein n=1 Tax=Naegleria lovaniensis TaxID=51637 RepID=A0AA88GHK8_NAELO|nr:uncharacterized protein C9374_010007 [Naegleria lovaniensis]KAG2375384.1 hypothetical protein C9374_010007 [Naegleria lovaniensis]